MGYKPALHLTPRTTSLTIRSHIVILSISSNDPSTLVPILRSSSPRSALVSSVSVMVDVRDALEGCLEEYMDDTALLGGGHGYLELSDWWGESGIRRNVGDSGVGGAKPWVERMRRFCMARSRTQRAL
jgi:hypothetical protein